VIPESLGPQERQLLLSQYLDGELDASTRGAVEERLIDDPEWRRDLADLKAADAAAGRTLRRFHRDDRMSRAVLARIKGKRSGAHPHPVRLKPYAQTLRGRFRALVGNMGRVAALAVFGIGAWYSWNWYEQQHSAPAPVTVTNTTPPTVAATPNAAVAQNTAPVTPKEPELSAGVKEIAGKDGTRILARNGSRIDFISDRHVHLHGEALFVVAKGKEPFLIDLPGDRRIQVLGTRFDVKASSNDARIRVAEGHVRFAMNDKKLDAFGGTEIAPDLSLKSIDPRQLATDWNAASNSVLTDLAPAWPQAGGSAGRSGTTPVAGPTALVARPEKFYEIPDEGMILSSAVVDAKGNAFLMKTSSNGKDYELWKYHVRRSGIQWIEFTGASLPVCSHPVITPEGLIVVADATQICACSADDMHGSAVWSAPLKAVPKGLCVVAASLLVGTFDKHITAWDTRTGEVKWTTNVSAELTGPVSITPSGQICAVAGNLLVVLSPDGVQQKVHSWKYSIAQAPVVTEQGDLWLQDKDGHAAKLALSSGEVTTAVFKKPILATPLSNGLFGAGPVLQRFDQSVAARPPAPDSIMALAQDGKGQVFAAYKNGVLRLQPHNGGLKEMEFANTAKGEILPGGIAISPGRVIVTTTRGVQIFE